MLKLFAFCPRTPAKSKAFSDSGQIEACVFCLDGLKFVWCYPGGVRKMNVLAVRSLPWEKGRSLLKMCTIKIVRSGFKDIRKGGMI